MLKSGVRLNSVMPLPQADGRFDIKSIMSHPYSTLIVIEAVKNGETDMPSVRV